MSFSATDRTPGATPNTRLHNGRRIDGWKEIATYLDRGERTVKRWEADRGLPVHRLPGTGRASVYAYEAELDGWLASNKASGAELNDAELDRETPDTLIHPVPATTGPVAHRMWRTGVRRFTRLSLVAVVLLILGISLGFANRARTNKATLRSAVPSSSEKTISHDLYLTGRFEWNKRTPDGLNRALNDFTQAIVHDPDSAPAYSGLADTYVLLAEYSLIRDREGYSRAISAATKAVQLDDSSAEAHRSLGFAEIWGNWDFRGGERELRRALQLEPRDPLTHLWYATAFKAPAWYSVASHEFEVAQELDPTSTAIVTNKSIWLFENGSTQEGLSLARRVEQAYPDFVAPHRYLAAMHWHQRQYLDFLAESGRIAELQQDKSLAQITDDARAAYRAEGEVGLLRSLYASRSGLYKDGKLPGTYLAEVCIRLGRMDEAFDLLRDDYSHRRAEFLWILTAPDLLALHDDPRYQDLRKLIDYPNPPTTVAGL